MVEARNAYVSNYFKLNRRYAEKMGDLWVVISAKYGFIRPETMISEYDIRFGGGVEIGPNELRKQAIALVEREKVSTVVCLGGADYRARVVQAFAGTGVTMQFPHKGLSIGKAMAAAREATLA